MKKILLMAAAFVALFTSCSKDEMFQSPVEVGDAAFTATMTFNEVAETRHFINGYGKYEWEAGDMVGVSTLNGSENIPFVTKVGGTIAKFEAVGNDLAYLGAGPYYMAYPYGTVLDVEDDTYEGYAAEKISGLSVPATQRYRSNSFSTMTAPAIAKVAEFAEEGQNVEFQAGASMLRFYIHGLAEVASIELSVLTSDIPLSGSFNAFYYKQLNTETEELEQKFAVVPEVLGGTTVTVSFGKSPIELSYRSTDAVPVVFVINGGLTLANKTLVLTAKDANDTVIGEPAMIEIPNDAKAKNIAPNTMLTFNKARSFGLENYYVIDGDATQAGNDKAALDFITYAYFAQEAQQAVWDELAEEAVAIPGATAGPTVSDYNTLYANGYDKNVKALIVRENGINFTTFDAEAKHDELRSYQSTLATDAEKAKYQLYINALKWYLDNGSAIKSIAYNGIVGAYDEYSVIDGLKVADNGLLKANIYGTGVELKNVKLQNVTVKAAKDANAGFIAADNAGTIKLDIVLGSGNFLDLEKLNKLAGSLYGTTSRAALDDDIEIEELPMMTNVAENATIGQLVGSLRNNLPNVPYVIDLSTYPITSLDVPVIYHIDLNGVDNSVIDIRTNNLALDTYDKHFGVFAAHSNNEPSLVVDGTSYWNGKKAALVEDGYFTAEEFAEQLWKTYPKVSLTHNIDMQEKEVEVTPNTIREATVSGNQFGIKNINAVLFNNPDGNVSLFGTKANISNLTLSNVVLTTTKANGVAYGSTVNAIAGLALTGTAANVTVNDLTINIAEGTEIAPTLNSIGGVFATADLSSIDNVEVKSLTVNNETEDELKVRTGILAGTLTVSPDKSNKTLGKFVISGVNGDYNFNNFKVDTQGKLTNPAGVLDYYKADKIYASKYAFGTVVVDNAAFASNGIVKAELKLTEDTKLGWTTKKMAAGVVFANALLDNAAKNVLYDASEIENYDYSFKADAEISHYTVWGFNKK